MARDHRADRSARSGHAAVFAFVGQLGAIATAAGVGAAGNFLFLMFPVWRSLAIGTVAIVSRRMGEGRPTEAADATRQSLVLGAIAGVIFGAFDSSVFSAPLLRAARRGRGDRRDRRAIPRDGRSGERLPRPLWLIGTSAMRAAGDTRTPMFLSIAGIGVSVTLAYLFINVLRIGPMGCGVRVVDRVGPRDVRHVRAAVAGRRGAQHRRRTVASTRSTIRSLFGISLPSAAESATFSFGHPRAVGSRVPL